MKFFSAFFISHNFKIVYLYCSYFEEMQKKMYRLLEIVRENIPLEEVEDPLLRARYETYLKSKKLSDEITKELELNEVKKEGGI